MGGVEGAAALGSRELQEQSGCFSSSCSQLLQTHTFACLLLFAQGHPFILIQLITHMWNKVVPQPVMADKTYKSL